MAAFRPLAKWWWAGRGEQRDFACINFKRKQGLIELPDNISVNLYGVFPFLVSMLSGFAYEVSEIVDVDVAEDAHLVEMRI